MSRATLGRDVASITAVFLLGCAGGPLSAIDADDPAVEQESEYTLAGAELVRRGAEIQAARESLAAIQQTLRGLQRRPQSPSQGSLADFAEAYLGFYVSPLLSETWHASSPELMEADASLRLATVDVLLRLKDRGRALDVLATTEQVFAENKRLLVEDPWGSRRTLSEAIEMLKSKSFWSL